MINKFQKIIVFSLLAVFLFSLGNAALAQRKQVIYFFYGDGCPHCAQEEIFLNRLEGENKNIEILRYEVWHNSDNAKMLREMAKKLKIDAGGVPVTIIGERAIIGYGSDDTTGQTILKYISDLEEKNNGNIPETIKLPFFGEVKIKNLSLPVFTILIGGLDGFNPCAMWILLFLISLLLGMQDRKKMWILGSAFIASSGAVYFLFLSAWLNLFLFLGFIVWIRIVIGLVALASGGYHLKEYWTNREGYCKVTKGDKRQKMFAKLKSLIEKETFWFALLGIIILAAAVNLVELVCSAGLPAVYTQVLALSNLPSWQYYLYLLLYIFVFMLDDMLVFGIAMITLREKVLTAGYTRWSSLIGGIVMLIIGLLLIFRPGWIMF